MAVSILAAVALGATAAAENRTQEQALEDQIRARDDRIDDLERKVEVLAQELANVRTQVVVPDEELESVHGFAPAASKVYGIDRGLSLGGYGEAFYRNFIHDQGSGADKVLDDSDFLRLVLYVGYKFSDRILMNAEIEFEHASTGEEGEVSLEFATLDFLWEERLNARAGLVLLPMGWVNEIHEPPFFFGVQRPETERRILPSTWRENGAGIFGRFGERIEYRSYVVTGFDATGFSDAGIRGGRQKGSESLSEDLAWVARVDWTPRPEWTLGGSFYTGKSGQDQTVGGEKLPGSRLTIWELHGQYRRGPWHARALFAMSQLANAGSLNRALGRVPGVDAPIPERMLGGYVEAAYDIWSLFFDGDKSLSPFLRVEYVDTQDEVPSGYAENRARAFWLFTPGISFKPHPNVVLKVEYRNFQQREGDRADEIGLGMGFAF
jgi:hypothetical protein